MKIVFDENFSIYLARGISDLQCGINGEYIEVSHVVDKFGKGKKDEEWIPEVAKEKGIIITQDTKIARMRSLWEMCKSSDLGIFFIKIPRSYKYWDLVQLIIKKWSSIKDRIKVNRKPFAYTVTPNRVKRFP